MSLTEATLPRRVEVAPMSRALPAEWTEPVFKAAYAHAVQCYPAEAAGVVEGGEFVPLDNLSNTASEDVQLSDADLLRVSKAQLFFHTHPDGLACPSEADMIYQRQLGIPFVTMCLPLYDLFCHGDTLERRPLLGRGFRHGVHDCYALIRDWYAERGITRLWDQPRAWEWWQHGQDLYRENFKAAGFHTIDPAEAYRQGDLLLFSFNYGRPMHGAIVHDRDLLMHHPAGTKPADHTRLSKLEPGNRLRRFTTLALRHEDLNAA
jgi:proteasome lid subunit RPN8/RPN11